MGRRILYLTQWFDPEPMMKGIGFVQALKDRGYSVEVLTGFPNYPTGKLAPGYRLGLYKQEVLEGVRIHRVFLYPSHDHSSFGRAVNFLSFFVSTLVFCLFNARRFDAIYVFHPPITVGLSAALSGFVTRRPFLLDIQDLWPDSVGASGMNGTRGMARILGPICDFVHRRAALVIGQSKAMTECLIERGVKSTRTATIFNWADEDAARPRGTFDVSALEFEGRFNIVFGGNLGRVQGLETLVHAAKRAAMEVPEIQLTLIGDGVERYRLATLIADIQADNVKLRPAVPRTQIGDVFAAADVLVLHLTADPLFEITVPSKTQFYMAMGKPILIGVSGEAARIVTGAEAGVAVPPENVEAMANAMVKLARMSPQDLARMGTGGRAAYERDFSFASAIRATAEALETVLQGRNPR
jgi:glycosyltransferase involved in cell wall biosynthesis